MKKITLFFVLISTGLFSQSLQMPNIPSEGVTYQTSYINAYLNVSSTGPWDFTNLNPVDQSEVSLQSIEDSNFSTAVYPNTTHIKYGTDLIQYPGFTTSGYTYNGENSIIITNYSTPLTIHPFPFNVGDTHADGVFNIPFTCAVCPPSMFRDHEVTSEAVASGSVTLPNGTVFNDAILVHHIATFTDGQTGSDPCVTTRESWFWWAPDIGIPIVETFTQTYAGSCPPVDDVQFTRFYVSESLFDGPGANCPEEYELPVVWQDHMECEEAFAINNFSAWTAVDGDGGTTWGSNDIDFTNEGYIGTAVIYNHEQTTAVTPGADISAYAPYEGNQGMYFFASGANGTTVPNDDWMISPEFTINGVTSPVLTFWAKSLTDAYGLDRFQIGIGTSTNPEDFTIISSGVYEEAPIEWTPYEYDLSAYEGQTVRVGIHCVSNDSFILMMDSFKVEGTLGVDDLSELEMSIYPNPASSNYVTIKSPINGDKNVEIYDIIGNRIINKTISSNVIDISSLNTGMYLVKVTIDGKSKTSKLIVE